MATVLLIRHGVTETTGKRLSGPDLPLSEHGREQAQELAERLRGLPLTAIYASPLRRCTETAAPLAETTGLPVRTVDALRDTGYGRWSGRPLAQVARTRLWRILRQRPSAVRFPGGETLGEVQARVVAAVDGIAAAHPRGLVAVVCHADVVRLSLMHFAGLHLDFIERLVVAPASVSAVALSDGIPRILAVNWTGELRDLAPTLRPRRAPPDEVGG